MFFYICCVCGCALLLLCGYLFFVVTVFLLLYYIYLYQYFVVTIYFLAHINLFMSKPNKILKEDIDIENFGSSYDSESRFKSLNSSAAPQNSNFTSTPSSSTLITPEQIEVILYFFLSIFVIVFMIYLFIYLLLFFFN